MRFQTLLVLLLLGAGAVFVSLNPAAITRVEAIETPMGVYQAPLVGVLLIFGAAALLGMLASSALGVWRATAHRRTLETRLDQHERELAELKGRAYDEVSRRVEALQHEVSRELEDVRKILRNPTAARDTQVEKVGITRTS